MELTRFGATAPALLVGAGLAYLFDPELGRRRRALARDRLVHWRHELEEAADATARDVAHRAQGLMAEARGALRGGPADDRVLTERIRTQLGHVVSHPRAINVSVRDGHAVLDGAVLESEAPSLARAVAAVRGVRSVDDLVERHATPEGAPALQGGREREGRRFELLQENWSPTARLLVGAAGGLLAASALRRHGPAAGGLAVAGAGLLARAVTNLPMKRLVGIGAGRRAVDVQKPTTIDAPEAASHPRATDAG